MIAEDYSNYGLLLDCASYVNGSRSAAMAERFTVLTHETNLKERRVPPNEFIIYCNLRKDVLP